MNTALMLHVGRLAREIAAAKRPLHQRLFFDVDGSPICLGGYMCLDPVFVEAGLKVLRRTMLGSPIFMPGFGPDGDEWMACDALENLLQINELECCVIFGTPEEVSKCDARYTVSEVDTYDCLIERVDRVIAGEFSPNPRG